MTQRAIDQFTESCHCGKTYAMHTLSELIAHRQKAPDADLFQEEPDAQVGVLADELRLSPSLITRTAAPGVTPTLPAMVFSFLSGGREVSRTTLVLTDEEMRGLRIKFSEGAERALRAARRAR